MSPTATTGIGMLEYQSKHQVLICRKCKYAIQKSAINSHLLRHKIYRGERQRLLASIAALALLEPHDVPVPDPRSAPISSLPVFTGYRCTVTECRHLAVAPKRMKTHWREAHDSSGPVPDLNFFVRPANIQTFFRGVKIRYFEVSAPGGANSMPGDGSDSVHVSPAPTRSSSSTYDHVSPPDLDLEALRCFHHFVTVTAMTLPVPVSSASSSNHFWRDRFVYQALKDPHLMSGLQALAVCHLIALTDTTTGHHPLQERSLQLFRVFSSAYKKDEINPELMAFGKLVENLLSTCLLGSGTITVDEPLRTLISSIKGCLIFDQLGDDSDPDETMWVKVDDNSEEDAAPKSAASPSTQVPNPQMRSIVPPSSLSTTETSDHPILPHIRALSSRLTSILGRPDNVQDVLATLSAIDALVTCCQTPSLPGSQVNYGVSVTCTPAAATAAIAAIQWLHTLLPPFHTLLSRRHPAATVILAYWAAGPLQRAVGADNGGRKEGDGVGAWWFWNGVPGEVVRRAGSQLKADGHGRRMLDLVIVLEPLVAL